MNTDASKLERAAGIDFSIWCHVCRTWNLRRPKWGGLPTKTDELVCLFRIPWHAGPPLAGLPCTGPTHEQPPPLDELKGRLDWLVRSKTGGESEVEWLKLMIGRADKAEEPPPP